MAARSDDPSPDPSAEPVPPRAVFRMPLIAVVLLPVLAAFCLGPIATVNVWWSLLLLVPVLIGVAVLLTRTVVDGQAISVHGLRPTRRLRWEELDRLEFSGPRWAVAVGTDERRIRLPMVRPRDLPVLAAVSGGYLTFTPPPDPGSAEEAPETGTPRTDAPDVEAPTGPTPAATPPSDPVPPAHPSGGRAG